MKATFVVHEAEPLDTGTAVVARPVVNEEGTNREWSAGRTPTGELRLLVTNRDQLAGMTPGARLVVTIEPEKPVKAAAKK